MQVIKAARTDLSSLFRVSAMVHALPDNLQTDCFTAFYHHLQKPIEQQLCETDDPYSWILEALLGVKKLGTTYFARSAVNKQRFIRCWPHIFKWLKAILDVQHSCDEGNLYSSVAGEAYNICLYVYQTVLFKDEVVELAVRAWMGHQGSDGKGHYTGRSLMACLMAGERESMDNPKVAALRIEKALHACDIDINDLTTKLVARLKHVSRTSPTNGQKVITLANVMGLIVRLQWRPFTMFTVRPSVGRCFVSAFQAMLSGQNFSMDLVPAVRSLLNVVYGSLLFQTIDYAIAIMEEGILLPLLQLASLEAAIPAIIDPRCESLTADILHELLLCLIFSGMVITCQEIFGGLSGHHPQALLKKTTKDFRETWKAFENVLLEHSILLHLFKAGFAPELGICASVSTISLNDIRHQLKC